MGVTLTYVQPAFADILTEEVEKELEVRGPNTKVLFVKRPDYMLPVGGLDNLHRTTIYLADKDTPKGMLPTPGDQVVHISNLLTREEGQDEADVMAVVFESFPGTLKARSVTRHYISRDRMDSKLIKVTFRLKESADHDIWKFLATGEAPAMS